MAKKWWYNFCQQMVKYYNKHREDLYFLKELFRKNRKIYNKMFRTGKDLCVYEKYITNKIDYDEFRKEINKLLAELFDCGVNINQDLIDSHLHFISSNVL